MNSSFSFEVCSQNSHVAENRFQQPQPCFEGSTGPAEAAALGPRCLGSVSASPTSQLSGLSKSIVSGPQFPALL